MSVMANDRPYRALSIVLVYCLFLMTLAPPVLAIDRVREKVIAEKLTERLKIGSPVNIPAPNGQFFAIFTESLTEMDNGVVIIAHGMAAHPDWPNVVTQLRTQLPLKDWSTLSIQMPVLASDENVERYGRTYAAAEERISAAIEYLQQQDYERIVLLGYGFGAASSIRFAANKSDHSLLGLVSVSLLAQSYLRPSFNVLQYIESIQIPMLDVYGTLDFETIVESAADRRLASRKAENIWFKQIEIEGADHNYSGLNLVLIKRIQGWLVKLIENYSIQEAAPTETE